MSELKLGNQVMSRAWRTAAETSLPDAMPVLFATTGLSGTIRGRATDVGPRHHIASVNVRHPRLPPNGPYFSQLDQASFAFELR